MKLIFFFFAFFATTLRTLRLNFLFFNRKVREGMRKERKENVQFVPVYGITSGNALRLKRKRNFYGYESPGKFFVQTGDFRKVMLYHDTN